MSNTHAVQVENLRLRYGRKLALDGLTFTLAPGRIYGLLGRNGSGKTSLLSVLAAFRRASRGTVRVFGEPVFENPAATRQVCFVSSDLLSLPQDTSVREALKEAGQLREAWDAGYAQELVELFGIPTRQKIHSLSRGQKSAFGAVIGLASRAPLTIFDETYLGMDAPTREAFYDALLAEFSASKRTIILSTHLIDELKRILEEVLIIKDGRLLLQAPVDELLGRGVSITGEAEAVDRYVSLAQGAIGSGLATIGTKSLGRTRSVMLYGELTPELEQQARADGLDIDPLELQELFVHLTGKEAKQ